MISKYVLAGCYMVNYFAIGFSWIFIVKFTEEVVPDNMFGACYNMLELAGWIASLLNSFAPDLLPPPDADPQVLLDNRTYQLVICFPLIFGAIALISLFSCVKHDSPFYYMWTGKKVLAVETIKKYYREPEAETIYEELGKTKN